MPHLAPVGAYQTFAILAPRSTHFRKATCAEVGCENYALGWVTTLPAGSDHEALLRRSGRHWSAETRNQDGTVSFTFEPGQECFMSASHVKRLDRPETFLVRGGDDRGNPTGMKRVHTRCADWVENFAEHQAALKDEADKG
jgi:hypothetical protein